MLRNKLLNFQGTICVKVQKYKKARILPEYQRYASQSCGKRRKKCRVGADLKGKHFLPLKSARKFRESINTQSRKRCTVKNCPHGMVQQNKPP
jgi:hypothetical protein